MANVMGQLDWVMACLDTWSNVILDASVKVFLDKISI